MACKAIWVMIHVHVILIITWILSDHFSIKANLILHSTTLHVTIFTLYTEHGKQKLLTKSYLVDQWLQMSWPMSVTHNSTHVHYHCINLLTSMVQLDEHPHTWLGQNVQKACAVNQRIENTVRFLLYMYIITESTRKTATYVYKSCLTLWH